MMSPNESHHYVRRVVLPSGKTIEVVYFEDCQPEDAQPAATVATPDSGELHVCGSCESPLVHPVDWQESGSRHWQVTLRCPNCEWAGTGVFEQNVVDRFDEELDRGTEQLVDDLRSLVRANMEEEIERFSAALSAGHILPEDF